MPPLGPHAPINSNLVSCARWTEQNHPVAHPTTHVAMAESEGHPVNRKKKFCQVADDTYVKVAKIEAELVSLKQELRVVKETSCAVMRSMAGLQQSVDKLFAAVMEMKDQPGDVEAVVQHLNMLNVERFGQ